jgi:hypothetical protein
MRKAARERAKRKRERWVEEDKLEEPEPGAWMVSPEEEREWECQEMW